MDIRRLSGRFEVKRLQEADADQILALYAGNPLFYQYHPPLPTKQSILEDMSALPPGKDCQDKYYLGYYDADVLIAVLDLILNFPQRGTVYIGLFMVDSSRQGKQTGTSVIQELADCLKADGFRQIRLAIDEGNPQSEAFWAKNQFRKTGQRIPNSFSAYLPMERDL